MTYMASMAMYVVLTGSCGLAARTTNTTRSEWYDPVNRFLTFFLAFHPQRCILEYGKDNNTRREGDRL